MSVDWLLVAPQPPKSQPKKLARSSKNGLPAALNVARCPSALIVPPASSQPVKTNGVMLAPVTLILVETISDSVKAAPGAALMSIVPVAFRLLSGDEVIVPSAAGSPVQKKLYTVAWPIDGDRLAA